MDVLTPEQRHRNMAAIRGRDTRPELIVRRLVHGLGFRYRLHSRALPGRPDLAFASRRKVIFVHGCFWHMHDCPFGLVAPSTNAEFWLKKRLANVERDQRVVRALAEEKWQTLVVWECELKDQRNLGRELLRFLGRPGGHGSH
jgi:DNA mismatch endonuclease, patch repair protein